MAYFATRDMEFEERKYSAYKQVEKTITFTGATGLGSPGTVSVFTVTGDVAVKVFAVCTTNVAGANATLALGVTGSTAGLIAQTTATDIDAGEIWHDNSPDAPLELSSVSTEKIIGNSNNIFLTVGTSPVTGGVIRFVCHYKPISYNGKVEAA